MLQQAKAAILFFLLGVGLVSVVTSTAAVAAPVEETVHAAGAVLEADKGSRTTIPAGWRRTANGWELAESWFHSTPPVAQAATVSAPPREWFARLRPIGTMHPTLVAAIMLIVAVVLYQDERRARRRKPMGAHEASHAWVGKL